MTLDPNIGDIMLVFDAVEWNGCDVGDNEQFWHPATILSTHQSGRADRLVETMATVQFHHDLRVSHGHIVSSMRPVES